MIDYKESWEEGVIVRNLCYGRNNVDILNNVDLLLPRGHIYGLLGPSGCGKTTLLRCIVGSIQAEVGDVTVFGRQPGSDPKLGIPGSNVGYMPQEYGLYENLSILENVHHFARINGVSESDRKFRYNHFTEIFDIPVDGDQLIKTLSGGQKRRVSLVCCLIHRPQLIILDEPTAGVDPLLRDRTWTYLANLSSSYGVTIIITTHYIEEARQADRIGFMRKGRIIVEDKPDHLLRIYKTATLEDTFLTICTVKRKSTIKNPQDLKIFQDRMARGHQRQQQDESAKNRCCSINRSSLKQWFTVFLALIAKNLRNELRDPLSLSLQYFVSLWMLGLFFFCVGGLPIGIKLAVVNQDFSPIGLGQRFLDHIDAGENGGQMIRQIFHSNLSSALNAARSKKVWGVLTIPGNFTDSMMIRHSVNMTDGEAIKSGQMTLYADQSDQIVSLIVTRSLQNAFIEFAQAGLRGLGLNERLASPPISMASPIYGRNRRNDFSGFRKSMFPGFLVNTTLSLTLAITALALIEQRRSQTFERSQVSGVTTDQIFMAYTLARLILNVPYVLLGSYLPSILFQVDFPENIKLTAILLLLQILLGTWGGCVLAAVSAESMAAMYAVSGIFVILLFVTGSIWPIEAMPVYFRWISCGLPGTGTVKAYRSVLYRGWTFGHPALWPGLIVDLIWCHLLLLIALRIFK